MAIEITLGEFVGALGDKHTQCFGKPFDTKSTTFTPSRACVARCYATADATLTINGIAFTVPSGSVEYFQLESGAAVTVA